MVSALPVRAVLRLGTKHPVCSNDSGATGRFVSRRHRAGLRHQQGFSRRLRSIASNRRDRERHSSAEKHSTSAPRRMNQASQRKQPIHLRGSEGQPRSEFVRSGSRIALPSPEGFATARRPPNPHRLLLQVGSRSALKTFSMSIDCHAKNRKQICCGSHSRVVVLIKGKAYLRRLTREILHNKQPVLLTN